MKTVQSTNGKEFIVDDEDFERVIAHGRWSVTIRNYVITKITTSQRSPVLGLHRWLLGLKRSDKVIVDHIDRNPLNNQKSNLRLCTQSTNGMNVRKRNGTTSKYRGVSWRERDKKWRAYVNFKGKLIEGGQFNTENEAAQRANELRIKYHGKFANLNIIS